MAACCRRCERPLAALNAAVGKGGTSSAIASGGRNHTKLVCQATPRPDSELAGPRWVEEGRISPTAGGWKRELSPTASCRPQFGNRMKMRTGRHPMSPLALSPACSLAENLQISQVQPPLAFNTKRKTRDKKRSSWRLGSWNVHSLLDAEGPVETGKQGRDVALAEDRRIDHVVSQLSRYKVSVAAWCRVLCVCGCIVHGASKQPRKREKLGQQVNRKKMIGGPISGYEPTPTCW